MQRLSPTMALIALLATPAGAGTFTPPEGCTGWMTVQSRACRVSNYYKCTADAPGDQWRGDFDQEGIFFLSRIDYEAQWVESVDLPDMIHQRLDPGPADPASYSGLMSSGVDDFAFGLSKDNGERTRVSGQDKLTGKTFTIDGISLQQTQFEFTETDTSGNILRRSRGNEYVNPEWRLFFSGPGEADFGDGQFVPIDGSPVQFIFPGEPGFMATQPLFECDVLMSQNQMGGMSLVPVAVR
jgi:hypothetical protein